MYCFSTESQSITIQLFRFAPYVPVDYCSFNHCFELFRPNQYSTLRIQQSLASFPQNSATSQNLFLDLVPLQRLIL